MTFELLAQNIEAIHSVLQQQAAHAVNLLLTSRNWLMGCYIVEFEQNGEDRAQYGAKLLKRLEERLQTKGLTERRFREFRRLYLVYPQLGKEVLNYVGAQQIDTPLALPDTIRRLMTAESENAIIRRLATAELEQQEWQVPANRLFYRIPIGLLGGYWSSTLNHKYPEFAWGLYFFPSSVNMRNYNHCFIQSVRLVR